MTGSLRVPVNPQMSFMFLSFFIACVVSTDLNKVKWHFSYLYKEVLYQSDTLVTVSSQQQHTL